MAAIIQPTALLTCFHSLHFPSKPPLIVPLHTCLFKPKQQHHHQPRFSVSTAQSLLSSNPTLSSHRNIEPLFGLHSKYDTFIDIDIDHLLNLLRISVRYTDFDLARALHASILKLGEDTHLGNALVVAYLKLGLVLDAYEVFKGLCNPDVVSYSSLISSFAKGNQEMKAIELFFRMRSSGVEPNEYSYVAILTACIRILNLELGFQVHALLIKLSYLECVFITNAMMSLYGKSGSLDYVLQLFVEMPQRDIATWNTVISSLVNELSYEKALELFRNFYRTTSLRADQFTLSTVLTACAGCYALMGGREVHAHAIRIGLEDSLSTNNAILKLYTKCGSLKDVMSVCERMPVRDVITWTQMIAAYMEFGLVDLAVEVFEKMPERNSVSYNALLAGFCNNGEGLKALDLFIKMVQEGAELSEFTLTSVITACGILRTLEISRQIHGFIMKFGFGSNACIETALLDMYTRCGRMNDADKMFRSWPSDRDSLVIQTSMLCGYARNGMPNEAVSLFQLSLSEGTMVVDEVALTSVLGVCGTLGSQEMGEQIHCHALKTGFLADLGVGNSIISMYSKCCNMNKAIKSFNDMLAHDVVSWNCLIAGHLLHRQGDEALAVWSRMEKAGVKPDSVTFVLIISAYSHTRSDLVEDCRDLFFSMKNIYEVEPTSEHYASFVSVLGYWGQLEEAEDMIIKMPFNPEASVWRALLDSCRLHLNTSIGKRAVKHILAMEPQDPSTYALVSNLYSASGRWHCSEIARANMRKRGLRKHPCRSWVIHQKEVHSFYVRDKAHPCAKDIYSGLDILIKECLKAGYEPDTSFVLHEVEEHQKKDFLFYHSAKLAATYGLLKTRPGEPVHIVKNILLCGDCHTFLKYVSAVTKREIIVRDTSGFHCFSNGHCSCKDYWR
ncbi:pentatricopeptide repeat-containing protein At5g03800 [Ricinus communis]|uniref:pentatricopeptide repeat-containing protein At5g03800 n=1 Tax=Ricinus communis TaxID=3988 RepID=UPI00201AB255|nr:pentatricopeptide repeat-containing protein At5g03800 [Ricinus communis]